MDEQQQQPPPPQPAAQELQDPSLVDQILDDMRAPRGSDARDVAKKGIAKFIEEWVSPSRKADRVDKQFVDALILQIDKKLTEQMNAIMHHERFQALESAWRGLKFTVDRTNFRENIQVEIVNCSKEDLIADFADAAELSESGLHRLVYSSDYGMHGGRPYAAVFSNYEFGPGARDVTLLRQAAGVAAMSHAPFFGAASADFFGADDFPTAKGSLENLTAIFQGPQYKTWLGFRESEDARYAGLVLPRFLLRLPYGRATLPVKSFQYEEDVAGSHQSYLWGNATFAFATRLADSFANYRWCANIVGPQAGGTVDNLPLHTYEALGEKVNKIPTEIAITDRAEFLLSEQGFIPLLFRKDSDNAAFFSAASTQAPKTYGISPEGKAAELNYRLGTQLPYLFIVSRLAHYLKVLQREQLGTWTERQDLELGLNKWLQQFVVDADGVSKAVRSIKPLRKAQVTVEDVPGQAGWYKVDLKVRPHFQYQGAFIDIGLVGRLDKA